MTGGDVDELRRCIRCGGRTKPGRFRCDACQANAAPRPRLRVVTLPGTDADQVAASRARHPSTQPPADD